MKIKFILISVLFLAVCSDLSAQTASQINAAKNIAKSYGYTEKEINDILNKNVNSSEGLKDGRLTNSYLTLEDTTDFSTILLEPVFKDKSPFSDKVNRESMIYGHDYFISEGLASVPSQNSFVPEKYVLGPGDEVVLDIWGATVSHGSSVVGNDGSINLQGVGPVYVSGMTLAKAENVLKDRLTQAYAGLSDDRGDTFIKLSVGRIKGVSVNISGEVVTPGLYSFPSLTSIQSAIFMAGGVTENGSVRNINLYRRGKKVATFDLYDFLFNGKVNENLRLQDGDVVNVEAYHNVVSVSGAVIRPMKYEMKDEETIEDLVNYASGFRTNAQKSSIHISRVGEIANKDFDVSAAQFSSFKLEDGDAVSVRTFRSVDENSVSIVGPVKYPGDYAIDSDVNDIASLIALAGGLVEGAFTGYGQINRLDADRQPEFISFDLNKVLAGVEKISLRREDIVVIYSKDDFVINQSVNITGAVEAPGYYSFHEGMTMAELIELAGGLSEDAYLARGVISHNSVGGKSSVSPFSVFDAIDETRDEIILLRGDDVHIYKLKELKSNAAVSVVGEVNAPGVYTYRPGLTISDIVNLAMGFTDAVDLSSVELAGRGGKTRGSVEYLNLEDNPELFDKELSPYDLISFRRLPYFRPQTVVTVSGEVVSPGTYVVDKPEVRISDIVSRMGGFTDVAYVHGAKLYRKLTEEEIERQKTAVLIANQTLDKDSQIDVDELGEFYAIGVDFEKAINHPGSVADVVLREGDEIEVPQMNNTVKVSGSVFYPNTVAYDKNLGWKQYIRQAGGFAKNAKRNKTYAVYMNGMVSVGNQIKVEPGMELVVPERGNSDRAVISPVEIASLASSATSVAALVTSLIKMF